ncbi:MAG: phosphoribosylamine--glycine ligase [Thermoanaerobaculia bacterium]|nr:phosphoribosylamine--glycine ligase [Thermoanaerobaculia bacterium]
MKVLVVGGGGREHALCWKLRQSPEVQELYCAPGNPGIGEIADLVPRRADEVHELAGFAAELGIDLTVVGPELPLSLGIVDEFLARDLAVFGPSQAATEIEASKVFAKEFMERHDIPTGRYRVAHDREEATEAAREIGLPLVLKADGLAAGKGVLIAFDEEELERGLHQFFELRRFGTSGDRIVVEEFLDGREVSFIVFADGERVLPLAACRDYKRLQEGDRGPNTGGMGAHSPSGVLEKDTGATILETVVLPTIQGMAEENRVFRGVLYAGLILTEDGLKVLEFNARLGDPETQPLMLRLEDDLATLLKAGAEGDFGLSRLTFRKEAAACVVLASDGYPTKPKKGEEITGLETAAEVEGATIFHAGTAREGDRIVSAGGRVVNACATGESLRTALKRAYSAASRIRWPSKIFRRDIGKEVLESSSSGIWKVPDVGED